MSKTETKTSVIVYRPEEGFLRVSSKADCEIEIEDARNDFEIAARMVNNLKLPVLADSRQVTYHSKEVREFYASREMGDHISAMAVLVESFATKLIGNFFIRVNKPHFPTKLFTDEKEAIAWLKVTRKNEAPVFSDEASQRD